MLLATFILRYQTVPTQKTTRSKPQKQHIVYQHHLYKDDEKLTPKDSKIFLIDNNEGFIALPEIWVLVNYIQKYHIVIS